MGTRAAFRARWVFPVDRPPLENGTVEIDVGTDAVGRIAAVHARHDPAAIDLGNVALLPGLVNAHAHLELSDIAAPLAPAAPFPAWLEAVIAHRRGRAEGDAAGAAQSALARGWSECQAAGTAMVGDIVSPDLAAPLDTEERPRGVGFLELIGLSPERAEGQLALARAHLADASPQEGDWRAGLSPHAPYSVHPDLFDGLVALASERGAPVAMHLAETRAELELLAHGTGEFVPFLQRLGVWRSDVFRGGVRPLDTLRRLAELDRALVVHGNYLAPDELEFLATCGGVTVVYCPRTHAYFGHDPHPWRWLLDRGVNVALGTDSRASNPDLSLWQEVLFLQRRFPAVEPRTLLELATRRGARALGQESVAGALAPGVRARLAVAALPDRPGSDPYALLLDETVRIRPGPRAR